MNVFKLSLKQQLNGLVFNVLLAMCLLLTGLSTWSSVRMAEQLTRYTLNMKLSGDIKAMSKYVSLYFGRLRLSGGKLIDIDGEAVEGRFELVDQLSQDLGVVSTIFSRDGTDFTRITTSIRHTDGKRAVGTKLGTSSAAYQPVMKKNLYLGEAIILGESYLTAYQPVFDDKEDVIGILFLGIPQKEVQSLIKSNITSIVRSNLLMGAVILLVCLLVSFFFGSRLVSRLSGIIRGLTNTSDMVSSSSSQISFASKELADGTNEQATSIEETSSSLEEMASMTRQNADNANKTDILMKESSVLISKGVEFMSKMSLAIERVKISSSKTADIIKTIDDIAFKTNLLALNASVEAARAGEAGAGFAVVADEVRHLAKQSAEAAKNTAGLIDDAQKNADSGVAVTSDVSKALLEIQESAAKVASLVEEIAEASKEQENGLDQVNTAMVQIDKVVQENASNADKSSGAADSLLSLAQDLKSMVDELIVIVEGEGSGRQKSKV